MNNNKWFSNARVIQHLECYAACGDIYGRRECSPRSKPVDSCVNGSKQVAFCLHLLTWAYCVELFTLLTSRLSFLAPRQERSIYLIRTHDYDTIIIIIPMMVTWHVSLLRSPPCSLCSGILSQSKYSRVTVALSNFLFPDYFSP